MRGNGTKLAITTHSPPARLLDLTRLVRRAGRVLTGIDRVELAYLRALSSDRIPCWGLVRTRLGYVLLPPEALPELAARIAGEGTWPAPAGLARLDRRGGAIGQAALTFIRSMAAARTAPAGLGRMLARQVPDRTNYFNVGHSNLTGRVLQATRALGGEVAIFIHDVIPMTHPQFQRPRTPSEFEGKLRRVQRHASVLICNSKDTADLTARHMSEWGAAPRTIVSHLGTDLAAPDWATQIPDTPFFLCLGTIEPRKNNALLLDIWDRLGPDAPTLVLAGARGWNNDAVFARLDALPKDSRVIEATGLSDAAIAALMDRANGLLFPSFAEGYGLPAIEAAARGLPIVASDLPAFREVLGNIPIYASPSDGYQWEKAIKDLTEQPRRNPIFTPPDWGTHFKTVLSTL